MGKAGRPSKFSPARVKTIVDVLKISGTRKSACLRAGISQETFANYLRDRPDFATAVEAAENDAELTLAATIREAAKTSWQAAAWLLGRRRPLEWSARAGERAFEDQRPVAGMTDDERLRRIGAIVQIAARRSGPAPPD